MKRTTQLILLALVAVTAGLVVGWSQASGKGGPAATAAVPSADRTIGATVQATPPAVALQKLPGTYDQPLYVAAPPGDTRRLFVVEKTGRIRIVKDGVLLDRPFLNISSSVSRGAEQGLLSMTFAPDYARSRRFFVDYTNLAGDTRVVRFRAFAGDPDRADRSTRRVLLRVDQPYSNHNGGQLQFGPDGRLYVGMGDGGSAGDPENRAQSSTSRLGKMLRITLGTSPLKIGTYAKGLRNPWRFSFDRQTGDLWIGDVGQNAWEEVDRLRAGRPAGANLGWRGFEGTHVYDAATAAKLDRSRLVWPMNEYSHALGESVTGGYLYRGSAIAGLRGWYVFGDYVTGRIWALDPATRSRTPLAGADNVIGDVSSFGQDNAGELYVTSLAGSVYKIVPAP